MVYFPVLHHKIFYKRYFLTKNFIYRYHYCQAKTQEPDVLKRCHHCSFEWFSQRLTMNNLNLQRRPDGSSVFVCHFKDQALPRLIPVFTKTKDQFRLVLVKTGIRPSLTPALRLGLVGTHPTGALAMMAQQPVCERTRSGKHEVVHVIYCQSLTLLFKINQLLPCNILLLNNSAAKQSASSNLSAH